MQWKNVFLNKFEFNEFLSQCRAVLLKLSSRILLCGSHLIWPWWRYRSRNSMRSHYCLDVLISLVSAKTERFKVTSLKQTQRNLSSIPLTIAVNIRKIPNIDTVSHQKTSLENKGHATLYSINIWWGIVIKCCASLPLGSCSCIVVIDRRLRCNTYVTQSNICHDNIDKCREHTRDTMHLKKIIPWQSPTMHRECEWVLKRTMLIRNI